MTQKDKELLLKDLCVRLLYRVKVTTINPAAEFGIVSGISIKGKISVKTKDADVVFECAEVKPYLRSMSSMTEKEEDLLAELNCYHDNKGLYFSCGHSQNDIYDVINFLNSHHFDYRGLINKGLAIKAPEGMYNIK